MVWNWIQNNFGVFRILVWIGMWLLMGILASFAAIRYDHDKRSAKNQVCHDRVEYQNDSTKVYKF